MTSTKIKRSLSKFYGSGDETTDEVDDTNFDRCVVDDKNIMTSNPSNSSSKVGSVNAKNKTKNRTASGTSDAAVFSCKSFTEDIVDGFAFSSFCSIDDLEDFVKNNKGRPSFVNYKENTNKIFYEAKSKKQSSTPSSSQFTKLPIKVSGTMKREEIDDSSSDATVEENADDRMLEGFKDASEKACTSTNDSGCLDLRSPNEIMKVGLKRPPDEVEEHIESKRAFWDSVIEIKPNYDGLYHGPQQNSTPGPDSGQIKSGLKKEVVDDDDALIEGMTKREGSDCGFPLNPVDVKPVFKSDCEADGTAATFVVAKSGVDSKVELPPVKKETQSKRRSPTPDDVVVVLDDSSSHSGGTSWVRWYAGMVFGDGKILRNDSILSGCARTDVRYDASRVRNNNHKNTGEKKATHPSTGRRTSSIGPLSSSSSIASSKPGYSPRHRVRAESPRMSDRLPPFRPPAFVPPRLTPPLHATGSFCLPLPTVVPPTGLGVTLPPQQASMMMPGWGQFELLAQMAANQEMLRVQQGLNDRFLQDGGGGLRTMPLLGTGINIPMAIPGLQPTLTLRTEMHQHQHLHHHQHVVPASPYTPLPTVPPPVHPIQTQMAPPMYFQPTANIFSSSIHTRPGLPTRGAFIPMADHRSSSLPVSQLLAKYRDRDWKQSSGGNGRPGFKGRWCSAHVQLAWRILMHCRGMAQQQSEDPLYGSKFINMKSNDPSMALKSSSGRIGSPPPLRQGWMNNPLSMKSERSGQDSSDIRLMDFARKERETVLRINSGRNQVEDFPYSPHLASSHFLHQPPMNSYGSDKKDFLGMDAGMTPFNRSLNSSSDPSFYVSSKGPLNPFSSALPPFLPLGEDIFRGQQDRKLIPDKYPSSNSKDSRLPSPDSHHRNRTPSNSSLNSFPFFPPPPPPSNPVQPNLHISGLQSQRYGSSAINKPPGKQEMPLGFPNFHGRGYNKPYPGPEMMGGSLLPSMLDPSRRSPFLKHTDSRLASSPPTYPHLWGPYPPGMYPSATAAKSQENGQGKGSSLCMPVPPVPPLLPPYR